MDRIGININNLIWVIVFISAATGCALKNSAPPSTSSFQSGVRSGNESNSKNGMTEILLQKSIFAEESPIKSLLLRSLDPNPETDPFVEYAKIEPGLFGSDFSLWRCVLSMPYGPSSFYFCKSVDSSRVFLTSGQPEQVRANIQPHVDPYDGEAVTNYVKFLIKYCYDNTAKIRKISIDSLNKNVEHAGDRSNPWRGLKTTAQAEISSIDGPDRVRKKVELFISENRIHYSEPWGE